MRAITTTTTIGPDRVLTVQLPPDVAPGEHEVVVVLNGATLTYPARLPPPHPIGLSDPSDTFRREDLYGDDGR
jgi:hypothetical protein